MSNATKGFMILAVAFGAGYYIGKRRVGPRR